MIGFPFDSHVVFDENGVPSYDRAISSAPYRELIGKLFPTGVMPNPSTNLQVTAGDAMTVVVQAGFAIVRGCMKLEEADKTLMVQAANDTYDRIDTVVMRLDTNDDIRACELYIVQGVPATNPVRPELTRNASVYEIGLADILIPKNSTGISTSRITDTRYESERCGVISSISEFDTTAIYRQVQNDLNSFRVNEENEFATWSEAERNAYETWASMSEAEFEAWFKNLKDQLDDNQAAHLQKQIDELDAKITNSKLVHLHISYDPSLAGSKITALNGDEAYEIEASATGHSLINGTALGNWTITEDKYGTQANVFTVFYGNYDVSVGGKVFITVNYDEEFVNATIKLTQDEKVYTRTATEALSVLFCVAEHGVWNVSAELYGDIYSTTVNVTGDGDYEASLSYSRFGVAGWLEAGRVTASYTTLEEVFADEKVIRQLFTVHDSVDYLLDWYEADKEGAIESIINNDYCAKWINLRDYALDTLYSNEDIKALMDEADKYGYGEWTLIDDTWQPKGNIPIMTSNTAPYGNVTFSAERTNAEGYRAFSNNGSWSGGSAGSTNNWLQYEFVNPINLKRLFLKCPNSKEGNTVSTTITMQASADGSNWDTVFTKTDTFGNITNANPYTIPVDNGKYYKYIKFTCSAAMWVSGNYTTQINIQAYGRELSVSVPKMTSNTEPYGEADSDTNNTKTPAWKAFDKKVDISGARDNWDGGTKQAYVQYDFKKPVKTLVVMMRDLMDGATYYCESVKFYGSNDGVAFDQLGEFTGLVGGNNKEHYFDIVSDKPYKIFRAMPYSESHRWGDKTICSFVDEFQFYGFDYSERDFDTEKPSKYIYDHGVEFEEITIFPEDIWSVKKANSLNLGNGNATYKRTGFDCQLNLHGYNIMKIQQGQNALTTSPSNVFYSIGFANDVIPLMASQWVGYKNIDLSSGMPSISCDISNYDSDIHVGLIFTTNKNDTTTTLTHNVDFDEWWLE